MNKINMHLPEYQPDIINREQILTEPAVFNSFFFTHGFVMLHTVEDLDEKDIPMLKRFAGVFEQTYTRFLDLKKAEAQVREAQIEAALERVRSKTMAMHSSQDVGDAVGTLYDEVKNLKTEATTCGITIIHDTGQLETWTVTSRTDNKIPGEKRQLHMGFLDISMHPFLLAIAEAYNNKQPDFSYDLEGESMIAFFKAINDATNYSGKFEIIDLPTKIFNKFFFFREGALFVESLEELSPASSQIFTRFAAVFGQTYRRYLDLKKAEAQSRESQIEASLERVRSRSMGMHKSNELKDVVRLLYKEFRILVTNIDSVNIQLNPDSSKDIHFWASVEEDIYPELYHVPYSDLPIFEKIHNAFNSPGEGFFDYLLIKEEKDAFFREVFKIQPVPPKRKKMIKIAEGMVMMGWFHKYSGIDIVRYKLERFSEEEKEIVKRFAAAFEQTYIRFLDLQKAEIQAREAQIEAALERVRSKTMAMHKTDELQEVVRVVAEELKNTGVILDTWGAVICTYFRDSKDVLHWTATEDPAHPSIPYLLPYFKDELFDEAWASKNRGDDYFAKVFSYDVKNTFFNYAFEHSDYRQLPDEYKKIILESKNHGLAWAWSKNSAIMIPSVQGDLPSEEEKEILIRFAKVFEQSFIRFLDLQKAEAQAREAIKQASLDRIRGEIASMRTAEDLNRITPIIWRELTTLEVPFIRCGVFIIDEEKERTQVYLSTPNGKSLGVLNLSFDANELTSNTVEHWKKKQVYKEHWNKEEFINWTKSMMELGQVQNAETYQGSSSPPESLNLHFVPFTQGMLYVGDVSPLTDEKLDLVKTLAEAFSIAYARYEDFRNLEEAKNKIELTLSELKSAQAQLVHSEKMASLGELTAGIAHEIKNPLNFVNNFSEISGELLDEIKVELEKNDKEEVLSILEDLRSNLEKINQHGKRADSIVKGMLLHSRGTSGEKVLTDINDLLDQYVNLAYHGMRAQNKEFNITIEKDYDETLEKISVVPQDISRVFLNIINNACYAAYDRKKKSSNDFSPTLKVSTKNLKDKVEIRIGDNGNGIPKDILDKIFQPFFTTKPTGEGTGLGLSLSYDIVTKQHGGELKTETKEGEGTEFIIQIPVKTG